MRRSSLRGGLLVVLLVGLPTVASARASHPPPPFITGPIICTSYDGTTDDLLTAGLGASGLRGAAPGFADPARPTVAELRRRAIYNNYRALVDVTVNGGFGSLYGPNIDADGNPTLGEGKVAGRECLAFADDGTGRQNVTMMVQIPARFDSAQACIVAAPSSGSRGVYGAIGTAGEWGLRHGCAVAYTDKGTGMGTHDLQGDTVNLIDGVRAGAAEAGTGSNFTADLTAQQRAAFNAVTPNRFAFKHAHSQQNPERSWGRDVLQAVRFAFYQLRQEYPEGPTITPANTIVIASSVSNGGGASLRAAEQDKGGLIDGVAVSEPQVQPAPHRKLVIQRGGTTVAAQAKNLFDYDTIASLLQACASQAPSLASSPLLTSIDPVRAANRCAALAGAGFIAGATTSEQADHALAALRAAGWEPESDLLHASHWALASPAIAVTYANAYGRFSVVDNLCGFSFGATDANGNPVPAPTTTVAPIFANGNGIPPTSGINLINNNSLGGPKLDAASVSPSGTQDYNTDGALCLRDLFTASRGDPAFENAKRVRRGIAQVQATGDLHGLPAIIVHGRSDTLVPTNHSSRPYYGRNLLQERHRSNLHYYEISNGQHFDAFVGLPGFDTRYIPVHYYFNQAMDLMFDHLRGGAPLPASQVVRTTPRGGTPGAAPAISPMNVPAIAAAPSAVDSITFADRTLSIPD